MNQQDKLFLAALISSLAIIIFFMGAAISGYTVYTASMHCEGGICERFCYFDEDCTGNEVCCLKLDFGVCRQEARCDERFELHPMVVGELPNIERPASTGSSVMGLYTTLLILIIGVGAIYFSLRTKASNKISHK